MTNQTATRFASGQRCDYCHDSATVVVQRKRPDGLLELNYFCQQHYDRHYEQRFVWIVFDGSDVLAVCATPDEADHAYEVAYMKATDAQVPGLHIERFAVLGDTSEDGLTSWQIEDDEDDSEGEDVES